MQVGDAQDKRNRSGLISEAISTQYYFRNRCTGQPHVKCVRAKLNILPPSNRSVRSNMHRFEVGTVTPRLEYAPSSQMR